MILDRFGLTGKVAVVTGGGQGIGRGTAIGFAEAGADVIVAARTSADLDAVASEVRALGRRAVPVVTDVMRSDDLQRLVARTVGELGRLDVLVNNAGGTPPRPAIQTSEAFFETALLFNVTAPFLLTKLAARAMVDTAGGGAWSRPRSPSPCPRSSHLAVLRRHDVRVDVRRRADLRERGEPRWLRPSGRTRSSSRAHR